MYIREKLHFFNLLLFALFPSVSWSYDFNGKQLSLEQTCNYQLTTSKLYDFEIVAAHVKPLTPEDDQFVFSMEFNYKSKSYKFEFTDPEPAFINGISRDDASIVELIPIYGYTLSVDGVSRSQFWDQRIIANKPTPKWVEDENLPWRLEGLKVTLYTGISNDVARDVINKNGIEFLVKNGTLTARPGQASYATPSRILISDENRTGQNELVIIGHSEVNLSP